MVGIFTSQDIANGWPSTRHWKGVGLQFIGSDFAERTLIYLQQSQAPENCPAFFLWNGIVGDVDFVLASNNWLPHVQFLQCFGVPESRTPPTRPARR